MIKIWKETYFWGLPYNLAGAALVGAIHYCQSLHRLAEFASDRAHHVQIYRSYHLYLGRLEDQKKRVEIEALQVEAEKRHVEEVCALQCAPSRGWPWPSTPKITPLTSICIACAPMPSRLPRTRARQQELGCPARRRSAARHRKAGGARSHHQQARPPDSGRVRKDEDSSHRRRRYSGKGRLPLSGGAYRPRRITKNGMAPAILTGSREKRSPSARASWRRSIAWMRWPPIANIAKPFPWMKRCKLIVEESGKSYDPKVVEILPRRYP